MPTDPIALDDAGYLVDLSSSSDRLLVAFAGLAGREETKPFQFFRIASDFDTKRLFLRDLETSGYQRGIKGLGDDVRMAADGLRELIGTFGVGRVVFTGNSLGAFAALLFGSLLNVDRVVAFAPQTTYARWDMLRHRDRRWPNECRRARTVREPMIDVRPLLARTTAAVSIYYDSGFRLDRYQVERVAALPNVETVDVAGAGHQVTRALRDGGSLRGILNDALFGDS